MSVGPSSSRVTLGKYTHHRPSPLRRPSSMETITAARLARSPSPTTKAVRVPTIAVAPLPLQLQDSSASPNSALSPEGESLSGPLPLSPELSPLLAALTAATSTAPRAPYVEEKGCPLLSGRRPPAPPVRVFSPSDENLCVEPELPLCAAAALLRQLRVSPALAPRCPPREVPPIKPLVGTAIGQATA